MTLADLHPALGLSLTAGPLQLRGITDEHLVALCALAEQGIHPPGRMPFYVPWTDAPAGELSRTTAAYHWRARADFAVEVTSGAFLDNPASLAVSRKVGYRENGRERLRRRAGEVAVNQMLVLAPDDLVRGEALEVTGAAAFRRFIGLDAEAIR